MHEQRGLHPRWRFRLAVQDQFPITSHRLRPRVSIRQAVYRPSQEHIPAENSSDIINRESWKWDRPDPITDPALDSQSSHDKPITSHDFAQARSPMLRTILLILLIAVFAYLYRSVLFSRAPLLSKLKRIPIQVSIFAILALSVVNGFRGDPETSGPDLSDGKHGPDIETASAIAPPVALEPLRPEDAAAACVEYALNEARATEDLVAQTWLSSVEGFLETAPGEVTVQFSVGPRVGPPKGPQCRSEARLTCTVNGRDVKPITPVHMTGAQIAC